MPRSSTAGPPARPLPRIARAVVLLAAAIVVALGILGPARPAAAAEWGPGWGDADNGGRGWLGAFVLDGRFVYCLQPGADAPLAASSAPAYGGWAGVSGIDLARLNWAISTVGQTGAAVDAAAVQLFVWSLAAPAIYDSHPFPGDAWYITRVPPDHRAAVLARLAELRAGSAEIAAVAGDGAGSLELDVDPADHYRGAVRVSGLSPSGSTGVVSLVDGVFDATGASTIAGVRDGDVLPFTAVPPSSGGPYRVTATASFTAPAGFRPELGVSTTPGAQTLAGPGRPPVTVFSLAGADTIDRSTVFQPIVSTRAASDRVERGARFVDVLEFSVAPDGDGRVNRWFRQPGGAHLPVTASCRVYGPLEARPEPGSPVPPGAPLASSFVVTTGPEGPSIPYTVESEQPLVETGFYSTVCSIDAGSQLASTRAFLPPGYRFEDAFGLPLETVAVPFVPTIATAFDAATSPPGAALVDRVALGAHDGHWLLEADGGPVEVVAEGRYWFVREAPERAAEPPPEAELLATHVVAGRGPGTVAAPPVAAPDETGWVVAQWCVVASQVVEARCDDWGVPSETVRIVAAPPPGPPLPPQLAATGPAHSVALLAGSVAAVLSGVALVALRRIARR